MDRKQISVLSYAFYGFILGLFFPLVATISELYQIGASLEWSMIRAIHIAQPIMLMIDMIPVVLSASYALIGLQYSRFLDKSQQLDVRIQEQEDQIRSEQYFLDALINSTSFAIVQLDTKHRIITCNPAFEDLFGYTCKEIVGDHLDDVIASGELYEEASRISVQTSSGELARKVSKRKHKDGTLVDVEIVGVPVTVAGKNIGILGLYHDIGPRKRAEQALRESEARFRSLFNESPISLWEEDFSGAKKILDQYGDREQILDKLTENYDLVNECMHAIKIIDVNQATLDLYNANSKEELIENIDNIFVIESLDEFRKELSALVNGETTFECEIYNKKLTGELIYGFLRLSLSPGFEDTWERVLISIIDITERKEAEEKLRFMSFHDALTGLYNRAYYEEEIIRLSGSRQYPVSIIVCDVDGLKQINDQHGHDAGDQALKAAAKVLGFNSFRKEDMVARIGGDEFVIILPSVNLDENPTILYRIREGIELHNNSTLDDDLFRPISMSIGYAVVSNNESLEEGYKKADTQMYAEKMGKKTKDQE